MEQNELAKKLSLDARAMILTGSFRERVKASGAGQISGFSPHYTIKGVPLMEIAEGQVASPQQEAVAIEADFAEKASRPELAAITGGYGRALNMVHLLFGRTGTPPNSAEAAVLIEAGKIFRESMGQPTYLAAVAVLSTGAYGVAQGRLAPIGLFNAQGESLWIHPIAKDTLLKADYPQQQTQRSLQPAPPVVEAVAPARHWYEQLSEIRSKQAPKVTGQKLHEAVIERQADTLVIYGQARNKTEAMATAKREYAAYAVTQKPAIPLPEPAAKVKLSAAKV